MSSPNQALIPSLFYETVNAYQRTAALKAVVELDLFTAIAEGNNQVADLAARCKASERGLRILCDYLTIIGFLAKQDHSYQLTPESEMFLSRQSPAYLGRTLEFLLSPFLLEAFQDLAAAVRKGGTTLSNEGSMAPEHPVWVQFARAMRPMTLAPAQLMANLIAEEMSGEIKVLDIAAGHGMYGICIAQRNPRVEIIALDWLQVLEVAKENAEQAGVGGRYSTIEGSAFTAEYGKNYGLILLTNFLHHFDEETCITLLKKVYAALGESGRAITLEFIPNEDRISPPPAAMFSLTMLASTAGGDAYTYSELEQMFTKAGFVRSELHPLPSGFPQQIIISYK